MCIILLDIYGVRFTFFGHICNCKMSTISNIIGSQDSTWCILSSWKNSSDFEIISTLIGLLDCE